MNTKIINLVVSLVFAVITVGAFFWLWRISTNFVVDTAVADNLKPVEINTVKNDATSILSGLSNTASIPIPTPTEKMGKANPFK